MVYIQGTTIYISGRGVDDDKSGTLCLYGARYVVFRKGSKPENFVGGDVDVAIPDDAYDKAWSAFIDTLREVYSYDDSK